MKALMRAMPHLMIETSQGLAFSPNMSSSRGATQAHSGVAHPASLSGDSSLLFTAGVNQANHIQALQTDGFQVGTDRGLTLPAERTIGWLSVIVPSLQPLNLLPLRPPNILMGSY